MLESLALAAVLAAGPARAETLRSALASVYASNPELAANRAGLRATDEDIAQAEALKRPSLGGQLGVNQQFNSITQFRIGGRNAFGVLQLDAPLYRGGLIRNSVRAAEGRVDAGRFDLLARENDLFRQTATAYEDVRRDGQVVELNRSNVRVLERQLQQTRDRFEVGDLTRTDVAQAEARLAGAQAQLRRSQADLVASEQAFARLVGRAPVALEPPPPLGALPTEPARAVELALEGSPQLASARASDRAAGYDIGVARAQRRVTVGAQGALNYQNFLFSNQAPAGVFIPGLVNDQSYQTAGIGVTIPLLQGGAGRSRVRRAQAQASQARLGIAISEREVTEDARTNLEQLLSAREQTRSAEVQVRANTLALEGVRAENGVGSRTIIEVLNAEQELLNSRVALVRARRDEFVAGFGLLATLGRATADELAIDAVRYDPVKNTERVRRIWNDFGGERNGPDARPREK